MEKNTKTREKKYRIGVDLGGTKMLGVAFDEDFAPQGRNRLKTKAQGGKQAGIRQIIALIEGTLNAADAAVDQIEGIGIGCPGPVNPNTGVVLEMPNLGWKDTPVRGELTKAFGCPVSVINDVDAGIYAEYRFGAAKNTRCAIGIFPGTGIGGGCVYNGDIIRGGSGSCMEIGHIPIMENGALCGCGQRGCLEAVAGRLAISAAAAAAAYRGEAPHLLAASGTDLSKIRSGALAASIEAGDISVERIVRDAARRIGLAAAGLVNLLAPDVIVLGGGLVEALPKLFRREVEEGARGRVMPTYRESFRVAVAKLGDDATAIGAGAWAEHEIAREEKKQQTGPK
uniref:Glucokinase n=1 Tax=Candidatus Kentrum sp. TC TaxID=2126339 RepID=A0A450ZH85_9GAMM|nr:MAG: glucokinase [Candidatus Kentron sp. TC]VFK38659.1 MAG: glucokinase [Candidatus Kentron sp. TC]VFK53139.1 MAG: glucokinase [Candidatus Kentron sp. TC]